MTERLQKRRRRWAPFALAGIALLAAGVVGCVNTLLPAVDMRYAGPPARPPVLAAFGDDGPVQTAQEWTTRRAPLIRAALEEHVYGRMPAPMAARVERRVPVVTRMIGPDAAAEQWTVRVTPRDVFNMVLVTPKGAGPHPVVVMQNFCGNRTAFSDRPTTVAMPLTSVMGACHSRLAGPLIEAVFGRYTNGPPFAEIIARGYAVALFYAGDVVADVAADAPAGLAQFAGDAPVSQRPGAIAVWAWLYSRATDVLAQDPRIDPARIAIWGHSRNGKSALLAGAFDPRIAAVIAHQSGKGGATLTRSYAGESVAQITEAYPHWFAPAYAGWAGREEEIPVDQHQLLALLAPRPVFLGAARRDRWSDPEGAFRAARGADPVYELFGVRGLDQAAMADRTLDAELAFVLRGGRHGVTTADWRDFLTFLDAHLQDPP
ncbi:MAG: alpha/beta hydrolase [Hyphomonadaceae bacterium]|nr:alpha/beta hydrolase [Hyphomonadaceae bacterium]